MNGMHDEPWGQWVVGVSPGGEVRCLAVAPARTPEGALIGHLRYFDGLEWHTMARFGDVDDAKVASAAIQALVEAGAVVTIGGPSSRSGFGSMESGVEWVAVRRATSRPTGAPPGCDGSITRLHVVPLEDGSVVALMVPTQRHSVVALFNSVQAADDTIAAINDLLAEGSHLHDYPVAVRRAG